VNKREIFALYCVSFCVVIADYTGPHADFKVAVCGQFCPKSSGHELSMIFPLFRVNVNHVKTFTGGAVCRRVRIGGAGGRINVKQRLIQLL